MNIKKFLNRFLNINQHTDIDHFELYNTYSNISDAYIVKGVLETNGIKCFIEGDQLSSVYPSQLSFSGIRLFIRRADFLIANQLLSENLINP